MEKVDLKYKYFIDEMSKSKTSHPIQTVVDKLIESILIETDTSFATNMELAIVQIWNGEKFTVQKNLNAPGKSVVAFLKKSRVTGKAVHLGRGFEEPISITQEWAKWGASNPTPKTDLMVGKHKFSLKTGPAQLMSGGKSETIATFMSSLRGLRLSKADKKLIGGIEKVLDKFVEGGYTEKGSVTSNLTTDKILIAGDKAHKEMMKILNEFFITNKDFKNSFAQEAMSGEVKFGSKSAGYANWILNVSKDGKKNYMKKTNNKAYVGKVASAMKLAVRFKSTSEKRKVSGVKTKTGRYRFWSVVALGTGQIHEAMKEYEGQILTEAIFSKIWNRVKSFLKKIIEGVKRFIRAGLDNLFEFLGAEPEINFNNIVNFASV